MTASERIIGRFPPECAASLWLRSKDYPRIAGLIDQRARTHAWARREGGWDVRVDFCDLDAACAAWDALDSVDASCEWQQWGNTKGGAER